MSIYRKWNKFTNTLIYYSLLAIKFVSLIIFAFFFLLDIFILFVRIENKFYFLSFCFFFWFLFEMLLVYSVSNCTAIPFLCNRLHRLIDKYTIIPYRIKFLDTKHTHLYALNIPNWQKIYMVRVSGCFLLFDFCLVRSFLFVCGPLCNFPQIRM